MWEQKIKHFYKFSLDKNIIENCDLFSRPVFNVETRWKYKIDGELRNDANLGSYFWLSVERGGVV